MHKQRIAIILSAIAGIIAVFLPFIKSFYFSVSLIEVSNAIGYIIILLFIISLTLALGDNHNFPINNSRFHITVLIGILPSILTLFVMSKNKIGIINVSNISSNSTSFNFSSFGIGLHLIFIASLAILLLGNILNVKEYYPGDKPSIKLKPNELSPRLSFRNYKNISYSSNADFFVLLNGDKSFVVKNGDTVNFPQKFRLGAMPTTNLDVEFIIE
jgi:hypothetical protein